MNWKQICTRLLTSKEAAEQLGYSEENILVLVRAGKLRHHRIGARGLVIDRDSVKEFKQRRK